MLVLGTHDGVVLYLMTTGGRQCTTLDAGVSVTFLQSLNNTLTLQTTRTNNLWNASNYFALILSKQLSLLLNKNSFYLSDCF